MTTPVLDGTDDPEGMALADEIASTTGVSCATARILARVRLIALMQVARDWDAHAAADQQQARPEPLSD